MVYLIVPEYSILLVGNGDSSLIEYDAVLGKKLIETKMEFFAGEKCRCKETEDVDFSEERYYSNNEDLRVEFFGDIRGNKIFKVSVALAKQTKNGLQLYESVKLKFPSVFKK